MPRAWLCRKLAEQHVDEPEAPAALDGASGYVEWMQVVLSPYRVELEKSRCETEHSLDEVPGVLAVFELDEAPYYSSSCRRE